MKYFIILFSATLIVFGLLLSCHKPKTERVLDLEEGEAWSLLEYEQDGELGTGIDKLVFTSNRDGECQFIEVGVNKSHFDDKLVNQQNKTFLFPPTIYEGSIDSLELNFLLTDNTLKGGIVMIDKTNRYSHDVYLPHSLGNISSRQIKFTRRSNKILAFKVYGKIGDDKLLTEEYRFEKIQL